MVELDNVKKKFLIAYTLGLALFYNLNNAIAAEIQFENLLGEWVNSRNSTLEVQSVEGNSITGTFTTAVARTTSCIGHQVPFQGTINGNAVAISINMQECGSPAVISLSGHISNNTINCFSIVHLRDKTGEYNWDSTMLLKDVFTRLQPEIITSNNSDITSSESDTNVQITNADINKKDQLEKAVADSKSEIETTNAHHI